MNAFWPMSYYLPHRKGFCFSSFGHETRKCCVQSKMAQSKIGKVNNRETNKYPSDTGSLEASF